MAYSRKLGIGAALLAPLAIVARADVYMSEEQAVQLIFPGAKMDRRELQLSNALASAIEKNSGQPVHHKTIRVFVSARKDVVFIDKVLGKHELITIAVGLSAEGTVRGVEILEYHETYGYQVRNEEWRKQFVGKNARSALKLGADIRNISGATLSSAHVTAGVKRLVQTYEALKPAF